MNREKMAFKPHVLVLPCPRQGHINPMLQFAKLLSHKGLRATLVLTVTVTKSVHGEVGSVGIETISDGYDDEREKEKDTAEAILQRLRAVGSRTLAELIERMNGTGHPVSCIVYDAILPWPLDVARDLGVLGAAFLTQPCIVDAVYYHAYRGSLAVPLVGSTFQLTGLPELGASDMPSFVSVPGYSPIHLKLLVNQFSNMETADWVLCNTFQELENERKKQKRRVGYGDHNNLAKRRVGYQAAEIPAFGHNKCLCFSKKKKKKKKKKQNITSIFQHLDRT